MGVPALSTCDDTFCVRVKTIIQVDTSVLDRQIEAFMKDKGALKREEEALKRVRELQEQLANLKKTNLFIKELVILGGSKIFSNFNEIDFLPHLQVPIDSVIRKVYWSLLKLPDTIDASHDEKIQGLAKRLFPDAPIYFDD